MYLKYADLLLKIFCDPEFKIIEPIFPQTNFIIEPNDNLSPDFNISLKPYLFFKKRKLTKMFSSPQCIWSLYKNSNGEYIIFTQSAENNLQKWIIELNCKKSSATVYYNKNCVIDQNGEKLLANLFRHPLDQLITVIFILQKNGLLIHSAGLKIDNKVFIFPGHSGAGKSTISNLCVKHGLTNWLSNDRMIARKVEDKLFAYGTPWPGKDNVAINDKAPLAAIIFVTKGEGATLKKIEAKDLMKRLLPVTSIHWYNQDFTTLAFNLLEDIAKNIPAYEFSYKPSTDAFHVIKDFIFK